MPRHFRIDAADAIAIAEAITLRISGRERLVSQLGLDALRPFASRLAEAARYKKHGAVPSDLEIGVTLPSEEGDAALRLVRAFLAAPDAFRHYEVDPFINLQCALVDMAPLKMRRPRLSRDQLEAGAAGDGIFGGDEFSRERMIRRYRQQLREYDKAAAELIQSAQQIRGQVPPDLLRLLLIPSDWPELNLTGE